MSICRGLIGQNNPPKNHFFPVHFALIFSKYRQSSPDIQQCTLVDFIAEKCQSDVFESFCFSTPLAHHLLTFNRWVVFGVAQKKTSVACGTSFPPTWWCPPATLLPGFWASCKSGGVPPPGRQRTFERIVLKQAEAAAWTRVKIM